MPLIFDIKRYAIHDGPGVRTTLFMKGCPLRCLWCHNPESWTSQRQRIYKRQRCIGCQSCVEACPQHALQLTPGGIVPTGESCTACGRCADECPTTALEMCGRHYTVAQLMDEVERERGIMEQSHGGVTLSGGEPLLHPADTLELLSELGRRGFHRCVDTTLYCADHIALSAARACELLLVDLKCMDEARHRRYTGVSNAPILRNLRAVAAEGHDFLIRIPLIVEVNAGLPNLEATAQFLDSLPQWKSRHVDLLPYHDTGRGKHERLWSRYNPDGLPLSTPTAEAQQEAVSLFARYGIEAGIGG